MEDTKASQIKRETHKVDAAGQVLGRLATKVATLLTGKSKSYFVRHLDCGDFVEVVNVRDIKVTGTKEDTKTYTRYSGYPGGLKKISLRTLKETKPEKVLFLAVSGMLPNNKLKKFWMQRLIIK